MRRTAALILAAAFLLTLIACEKQEKPQQTEIEPEQTQTEPSLQLTLEELPVIDGATALAPYYEAMTARLLGVDVEEARKYVLCSTTGKAYENLIDGTADMIFCARPSDKQVEDAAQAGVEFKYFHILNGGFVFFVNKDNPVDSLTVEQLRGIYSGSITNWIEVGGNDEEIIPYQRDEGSGSQTGLYRYIIPREEVMPAPTELAIGDMGGIIDAVAHYDNADGAIGYSYYYYVASMHYTDQIKLIGIDGIIPGNDTIGNGSYPLINDSSIIIRSDTPDDSVVFDIIDWVMSEEGAQLAEENGYVANRM